MLRADGRGNVRLDGGDDHRLLLDRDLLAVLVDFWRNSLKTEAFRLWTIQHRDAWLLAERRGVLRADGRRVWSLFRPAYGWMRDQMRLRIVGATGRYPIWAWARPMPDLRHAGHLPPGPLGVRIEFTASRSAVLLSDFDAWHQVLNQAYLALTEEEDEAWETRVGRGCRFVDLSSVHQAEVRQSWEQIFDLPALHIAPEWHDGNAGRQYIQATIEEIPLTRVVSVRQFIAR